MGLASILTKLMSARGLVYQGWLRARMIGLLTVSPSARSFLYSVRGSASLLRVQPKTTRTRLVSKELGSRNVFLNTHVWLLFRGHYK